MTPDELDQLRDEASAFLQSVQELEKFAARREELRPPPSALEFPFWSIRRVLAFPEDPIEHDAAQRAPGTGLLQTRDGELTERPRPTDEELREWVPYEHRLQRFAEKYLARPQWGARATHVALQRDEAIVLPHKAPDRQVPVPGSWVSGRELARIAEATRPRKELRGNRDKTWMRARAAVQARLQGARETPRRDALAEAARYLDAAVNGKLAGPNDPVEPLEPSDDPKYVQNIEKRFQGEGRLRAVENLLREERDGCRLRDHRDGPGMKG